MFSNKKLLGLGKKEAQNLEDGCKNKKCLYPNCPSDAINSHSIQRTTLASISGKNGLKTFSRSRFDLFGLFKGETKIIGSKRASVFRGFCNDHDRRIFEIIEKKNYKYEKQQELIFAYRAFVYDYVRKLEEYCLLKKIKGIMQKEREKQTKVKRLEGEGEEERNLLEFIAEQMKDIIKVFSEEISSSDMKRIEYAQDEEETRKKMIGRLEEMKEEAEEEIEEKLNMLENTMEEWMNTKEDVGDINNAIEKREKEIINQMEETSNDILRRYMKRAISLQIEMLIEKRVHFEEEIVIESILKTRAERRGQKNEEMEERIDKSRISNWKINKMVKGIMKKMLDIACEKILEEENSMERWIVGDGFDEEKDPILLSLEMLKEMFGLVEKMISLSDFIKEMINRGIVRDAYYEMIAENIGDAYEGITYHMEDMDIYSSKFFGGLQKDENGLNKDLVQHRVFEMPFEAMFAMNSMLHPKYDFHGKKIEKASEETLLPDPLFCNIFPQNGKTYVIFSYFENSKLVYKNFFEQIESKGDERKKQKRISALVLCHAENSYMSTEVYDGLTEGEKEEIARISNSKNSSMAKERVCIAKEDAINIFESFRKKSKSM